MTELPPLVIITDITDLDPAPAVALLRDAGFRVMILDLTGSTSVPPEASSAVAGIVGYSQITASNLQQLPHLRVLATMSVGTDMIDAKAAQQRNVQIIPLTGASTIEVATHAVTLMLAAVRNLPAALQVVRAGQWTEQDTYVPRAAETLTVGLLGYGHIAQAVAERAGALFGDVIAYDPYTAVSGHARSVSLNELFTESDILSLHVPATADSRGIVTAERLTQMRPGSILVNTSRGELVHEDAVISALDIGQLAAYCADVLVGEPPATSHPLRSHPQSLVTAHVAYRSDLSLGRYTTGPAQAIVDFLADRLALPDATNHTNGVS